MLCAVIVAAYQAPDWILGCLASIDAQEPLDGWTYETRIGVDGCVETSRVLREAGISHWYSPANVGPYLIRNALIFQAPADAFAIFDADDEMLPRYLTTLLPLVRDGISGSARIGMSADGKVSEHYPTVYPHVHGVSVFSAAAMKKLGGFRPWRIRADADAFERAKWLKIPVTKHPEPLFFRRNHPESLTQAPKTKMGSVERKRLAIESKMLARKGRLYVEPQCAVLEWREARRGAA